MPITSSNLASFARYWADGESRRAGFDRVDHHVVGQRCIADGNARECAQSAAQRRDAISSKRRTVSCNDR
jgi:hypothetical protein